MNKPELSVIVPTYNESKNIETLAIRVFDSLKKYGIQGEMIVDDSVLGLVVEPIDGEIICSLPHGSDHLWTEEIGVSLDVNVEVPIANHIQQDTELGPVALLGSSEMGGS